MEKQNAIWITGASSGIGKALALKFLKSDMEVIGSSRKIDSLNLLNSDNSSDKRIETYQCDVSNFSVVEETVKNIQEKYNISCLINNAGVTSFKPFLENSLSEIENIININLLGALYTTKSILPTMIKNNSGTIINILSVAAKKIFTSSSVYTASKAGLENFAKVLREEIRGYNIRIINVYPGATISGIWHDTVLEKYSDKMMTSESLAEFIFDIYNTDPKLSPEEIIVRPISGDL